MYYVDTKPAPCRHLRPCEAGQRQTRLKLGVALRKVLEALGSTGHRTWEQRRFAGLARLSARAGWTGRRAESEPGGREVADGDRRGSQAA